MDRIFVVVLILLACATRPVTPQREMQAAVRELRGCQALRQCQPYGFYARCYEGVRALCLARGEEAGCWQDEGIMWEPFERDTHWMAGCRR